MARPFGKSRPKIRRSEFPHLLQESRSYLLSIRAEQLRKCWTTLRGHSQKRSLQSALNLHQPTLEAGEYRIRLKLPQRLPRETKQKRRPFPRLFPPPSPG